MTMHRTDADDEGIRLGPADWLGLMAAPVFAIMALGTSVAGDVMPATCLGTSPFNGMVTMYGLMCAFHTAPWLRLMDTLRSRHLQHKGD